MTAVIYARYSTDSQREESIEGQIRECTAYAEKNGFTVVKHYIDRAISAKTDNRPQFQQMIKDSERGIFDIIIVWKLDRFARNRYDSARYKTQLKRNGVKLVSATEVISAGPEGIILESVLEGYAEYYSADLSEKVVRGMTENALKGIYNGGTIPFGYMIDETRHYQPDPLLAPYVEQTFQKYADGATMTDLRDWLKAHNIKNSMGGEMSYNTIQRMLSNRRYIGELRLRDVVQPNAIPALVSEDLFNKVQEKLAKNKKAPARHKAEESYLLTTKLYCGKCGALMFGESGVSHTGKMYTYYKCAAAKKKKTCDKKAVRKQWLEDLVVNETMKLVEDDASMNAIIAKVMELQNQESTDLPIYEKQLKETEVGITNMLNAIQMGILTSSTKERLEALEDQRKELQARIAEERLAKPKMKEEFVRFWLLRFRKLDMTQPEQRQALVDTFINAIYLYDDKVLITFNYKEGTETVAFGEAVKAEKSSDMSARGAPDIERQIVRFDVLSLCRKDVKRTRISSTLCVRLHSSAGWLQGSLYRRFLLPPAFHFAGAEVLPGSNLGNRSWLRFSRSTPAGVCPACGHIHFASFYLPGDFVPHIRIMNTGYQTASLGNLFGLPYVVMRKPAPIDTTTLNYNWQIWETNAFSIYTKETDEADEQSAQEAVAAVLRYLSRVGLLRYHCHSGYLSTVVQENEMANVLTPAGVILDPFTAEVEAEITCPTSGVVFFALKKPLTTEHEVAFKVIRRLHGGCL